MIEKAAKNFARIFNHKVSFESNSVAAKFMIPGFQYTDFDRSGQVNIYSLNRLFETGRLLQFTPHIKQLSPPDPNRKTVVVMFAQKFSIQPDIYKKFKLCFPMEFESSMIGVGRSAIVRKLTLKDISNGSVFATNLQKLVNIDKLTRKSSEIKQHMRDIYCGSVAGDPNEIFPGIVPQNPPTEVFTTHLTVCHSDMDMLFHTNQASYMKFALNCASQAASRNFFKNLKEDICFYNAIEAKTLHLSETFSGDELIVNVWEDEETPNQIHCMITRQSDKIYYSVIKFSGTNC